MIEGVATTSWIHPLDAQVSVAQNIDNRAVPHLVLHELIAASPGGGGGGGGGGGSGSGSGSGSGGGSGSGSGGGGGGGSGSGSGSGSEPYIPYCEISAKR